MKTILMYILSLAIATRSATALLPNLFSALNSPSSGTRLNFFGSNSKTDSKYPIMADESVMDQKAHGTSENPVMKNLRWNCDWETADRICNFNRHYAEHAGYWTSTTFLQYVKEHPKEEIDFFDSVTGALLFTAPKGRTMQEFLMESQKHGWPSFRDEEVNWDYVRVLKNGECISTTGTHLGHNLPDGTGNRYCINLVSAAGQESES